MPGMQFLMALALRMGRTLGELRQTGVKVTIEDAQLQWSTEENEVNDGGDPFAGLEAALLAASA
ncbi:MAG: hypothetical protein E7L14_25190 [Klebsiella pneumoniae]|nr:hypothetical protein [Klebsiella pneumoniae]